MTFSQTLGTWFSRPNPRLALTALALIGTVSSVQAQAQNRVLLKVSGIVLRQKPSTASPSKLQVSQGTQLIIVGSEGEWRKLRTAGGTLGWVRRETLVAAAIPSKVSEAKSSPEVVLEAPVRSAETSRSVARATAPTSDDDESTINVTLKTSDMELDDQAESAEADTIARDRAASLSIPSAPNREGRRYGRPSMVSSALGYRGSRYSMGATGANNVFDCSGFTQFLYRKQGISIPRTAAEQYSAGKPVRRDEMQPGDLIFFKNTYKSGISHVGMYIGDGRFIHAASHKRGVVIDDVDKAYYASKYAGTRRFGK